MTSIDVGDVVHLDTAFTNDDGEYGDPDALSVVIRDPLGVSTTYEWVSGSGSGSGDDLTIDRVTTGKFHLAYEPTLVGAYGYRWVATGVGKGAEPDTFIVRPLFFRNWRPSVDAVAAILRARTKDDDGRESPSFSDDTRPTADQVAELIDTAIGDVVGRVGSEIPEHLLETAREAVALRTAQLVEMGYQPEQSTDTASLYTSTRMTYEEVVRSLERNVQFHSLAHRNDEDEDA